MIEPPNERSSHAQQRLPQRAPRSGPQLQARGVQCPVCNKAAEAFEAIGKRLAALCPHCGAKERHRLSLLYLLSDTRVFVDPTRVLHFAPEGCLRRRFERAPNIKYTSAKYDADSQRGIDIQALPFADGSFDLIYCSHVLEHIPDDRKAMRELRRVLAAGGIALVMVPFRRERLTHEDPSITSPEERARHFGQAGHLRRYGSDLLDRLRGAGFEVETVWFIERYSAEGRARYGLTDEPIFACTKASA